MRTYWLGMASLLTGVAACSGDVGSDSTGSDLPGMPTVADGPQLGPDGQPLAPGDVPGVEQPTPDSTNPVGSPNDPVTPIDDQPVIDPDVAVEDAPALPLRLTGMPLYARAVRLTHDQWENSVRQLLAVGETGQRANLANDVSGLYSFENHEELLFMNANLYRDYQVAAEELAAMIGSDADALAAIYSGQDAQGLIETVGRRAFRRPLTQEEVGSLQALYDEGAALSENGDTPHARGSAMVLQALMQSPHFLFRWELTEPGQRLSGFELAAKLSLLLRNVGPDDALLDMAAGGQLDTDDGLLSAASSMIDSEDTAFTFRNFHGQLLHFDRYLQIRKDAVPEYNPDVVNAELEEAAYLFFDRLFRQDLGIRDMLTTTVGFVGPNMAEFYGVQVPGNGAPGSGLVEMDLGPDRPGFFTQLPFLVANSVNLTPDSIHRGVSINNEILCGAIPPPPDANVALVASSAGQTNRERVTATSGAGTCGQPCHAPYINPLGFAFENYDGLGRVRTEDNGLPVDTSSVYPFVEGRLEFDGAPQLMQILAEGEQAHACYASHLAEFALQRDLTEGDRAAVDTLAAESQAGASFKDLVLALVTNPAFTTRVIGGAQ